LNKLLVTGSTGFIGNYIIKYFSKKYQCYGISRANGTDISNYISLSSLSFNPKIIIHAAASLSNDIDKAVQSNVVGTLNICKFAKEKKVKQLILISSISIYNHANNQFYNNYAMTKKQAEEVAIVYCKENNINLTILRLSQVYDSNRNAYKSQKMLYDFIDLIQSNNCLQIYGDKNPIRNYIHVRDVLKILYEVIHKQIYGTYNIINPISHTITEIGYMIFKVCSLKPNILFLKDKTEIPSIYVPKDHLYNLNDEYTLLLDGMKEIIDNEK
jgi:nucleoside-diphosphate-sugar epimerase